MDRKKRSQIEISKNKKSFLVCFSKDTVFGFVGNFDTLWEKVGHAVYYVH